MVGDLKQEAHCRDVIGQTLERFGRLDILVNNAGIYTRGRSRRDFSGAVG